MQAIAKDGILPNFLAKGHGPSGQPRSATIVVYSLALVLLTFTSINQIIPIMTMACLLSYTLINFIAFMESFIRNPSWRPTLRVPPAISLVGAIGCLSAMFLINSGAAFTVFLLLVALCFWTSQRKLTANWEDIRYSIYSYFIHKGTVKLSNLETNAKNWRPHILALFDSANVRKNLVFFAHAINQEKGFLTFGASLKEQEADTGPKIKTALQGFRVPSHVHINTFDDPSLAAGQMIKNYGFGHLKPNTIFFSLPSYEPKELSRLILDIHAQKKNVVLLKDDPVRDYVYADPARQNKQIDLWWRGKYPGNFEFSLALAFLLQQSKLWPFAQIQIKVIAKSEQEQKELLERFEKYREKLRIKNLQFTPMLRPDGDFFTNLTSESRHRDLTFLGLKQPEPGCSADEYATYFETLLDKTKDIDNIAYVLAGESVQFRKIFL